jgi:sulfatase maturation enzyme AslB (radical SAM superfamily)
MARRDVRMQIEMTNNCNFKCVYCPHALYGEPGPSGNTFDRPKGYMDEALWNKAIAEAQKHAKSVTMGFFGEQLLHPQFIAWVAAIPKRRNFRLILNSNWALVTKKHLPALLNFDMMRISLDSTDPKQWDALCPGGPVFDENGKKGDVSRLEALVAKTEWWLAIKNRPKTNLIFVTQDENKDGVVRFVEKWKRRLAGQDRVIAKSMLTYGGVMFDPYMTENKCNVASENRLTVAWDGRITPCNLDVNVAMATLNLNTHTMAEILDSPDWKATLQGIRDRVGICANCFDAQNHSQRIYDRSGKMTTNRQPSKPKYKTNLPGLQGPAQV